MEKIRQIVLLALVATVTLMGSIGCNSEKKAEKQKAVAEQASRLSQAKMDLEAIINGEINWTVDEQQERLDLIKSWNLNNDEINSLISQAESKISERRKAAERAAEQERINAEAKAKVEREKAENYAVIERGFKMVVNAKDVNEANERIEEIIAQQYASQYAHVLIIISQEGDFNDYERPVNIETYLNYLKDSKMLPEKIESVVYDENGKITEIQVLKNIKK